VKWRIDGRNWFSSNTFDTCKWIRSTDLCNDGYMWREKADC
jgi:hypothetical protein